MTWLCNVLRAYWLIVTERDGHWHPHGIDGMRRWTSGAWEYRKMTLSESRDERQLSQW